LKLAQTILECAPLTVMFQRCRTIEFLGLPTDHQEETVGLQVQLPRLRIGPITDHQQQALRMPPRLGLILAEFDNLFIAALGRTPDRTPQMRRGESFEYGVALQSPDEPQFFIRQQVQRRAVGVAGVMRKSSTWPSRRALRATSRRNRFTP